MAIRGVAPIPHNRILNSGGCEGFDLTGVRAMHGRRSALFRVVCCAVQRTNVLAVALCRRRGDLPFGQGCGVGSGSPPRPVGPAFAGQQLADLLTLGPALPLCLPGHVDSRRRWPSSLIGSGRRTDVADCNGQDVHPVCLSPGGRLVRLPRDISLSAATARAARACLLANLQGVPGRVTGWNPGAE